MKHQITLPAAVEDALHEREEAPLEEGVSLAVFSGIECDEEDEESNLGAVEEGLPGSASSLLQELESRQDDVLQKLDRLNDRIEQTLAEMGRLPKEPKSGIAG